MKPGEAIDIPVTLRSRVNKFIHQSLQSYPLNEPRGIKLATPNLFKNRLKGIGEVSDTVRYQVDASVKPGTWSVHLKSFMQMSYRSATPAEARQKTVAEEARMLMTAAAEALRQAQASKDTAAMAAAEKQKSDADALKQYADQQLKQIKTIATMSQYGGRNYHISPAIRITVK